MMATTYLFQLIDQITGEAYGSPKEFTSKEAANTFLQANMESIIEEDISETILEESNTEAVKYYAENLTFELASDVFCFL